jgi:8-oxo-dGTP pyrophosphatase MutT (NUDIX family)
MQFFNIRVYGVLVSESNELLLSDELIRGEYYTKFPGGGLEFGEGTRECLEREFKEELDLRVKAGEHIYTTDYFQVSAFNPAHQIISIYYYVTPLEEIRFRLRGKPFDFSKEELARHEQTGETETFRFVPLDEFHVDMLTLPIDRIVGAMILPRRKA